MFASFLRFVPIGCEDDRKCLSVFVLWMSNLYGMYVTSSSSWKDGMDVKLHQLQPQFQGRVEMNYTAEFAACV